MNYKNVWLKKINSHIGFVLKSGCCGIVQMPFIYCLLPRQIQSKTEQFTIQHFVNWTLISQLILLSQKSFIYMLSIDVCPFLTKLQSNIRLASYLDQQLEIDNEGRLRTTSYDKRDDFNLSILLVFALCVLLDLRLQITPFDIFKLFFQSIQRNLNTINRLFHILDLLSNTCIYF